MEETRIQLSDTRVTDRWGSVLRVRGQIATELDQMAEDLPGDARKQLRSLSRWFQGPAKLEKALRRPDVLAVCLPWIKPDTTPEGTDPSVDVRQTVRSGFLALSSKSAGARRLGRLMLYPLVILVVSLLLLVAFSCTIAPQFHEMFDEFGIELPRATKFVFSVCGFVQRWWWAFLLGPVIAALCFRMLNRIGQDARPGNLSWLDQHLMSTRSACATWMWHVSLLLEAGLTQDEAVSTASSVTGDPRLRQVDQASPDVISRRKRMPEPQLLLNPKYHLAGCTLGLPESQGKIALMREVAAYYWDRNRNVGDWWIYLLNAFILWCVGLSIVFAIVSLFMPLIAIISGLTGNSGLF